MTDITRVKSVVLAIIHGAEGDTKRAGEATHALLSALNLSPSAASALMDGTATVVPVDPTDEQVDSGLGPGSNIREIYGAMLSSSPYGEETDGT